MPALTAPSLPPTPLLQALPSRHRFYLPKALTPFWSIPLNHCTRGQEFASDAWKVNSFAAAPRNPAKPGRWGVVWPFSRGLITNGRAFSLQAVVICDCSNVQHQSASHRDFKTQGHREQQPHTGRPALSLASVNLSPRFQSSNTKLPVCSRVRTRDVMFTPNSARAQTIIFYSDDLFSVVPHPSGPGSLPQRSIGSKDKTQHSRQPLLQMLWTEGAVGSVSSAR